MSPFSSNFNYRPVGVPQDHRIPLLRTHHILVGTPAPSLRPVQHTAAPRLVLLGTGGGKRW